MGMYLAGQQTEADDIQSCYNFSIHLTAEHLLLQIHYD